MWGWGEARPGTAGITRPATSALPAGYKPAGRGSPARRRLPASGTTATRRRLELAALRREKAQAGAEIAWQGRNSGPALPRDNARELSKLLLRFLPGCYFGGPKPTATPHRT